MKKLLLTALVAVATLMVSDCYSQSTTYYLLEAERSPKGGTTKTIILEEGERNGTKILVTAACPSGCTPAMYTYQDEPSSTLGKKVYFTTAGIYVMQYDDNSFVSIMPTKQLGKGVWDKFVFSNFYSKDAAKVQTMTKAKVEAYAIEMSKQILAPSTAPASKGGNGLYHAAVGVEFSGKSYEELTITYEEGAVKKIITQLGKDASTDTYMYLSEFSALIGTDIYTNSRNHLNEFIYVDKPGVLIWTKYKGAGLGKQEWGKYDLFNMYAMDKQVSRGLLTSESQQKTLDGKITNWSKIIKAAEDKKRASETKDKIAKQRLPKEGLVVSSLKTQTLDAAKGWATKWGWKETVTKAYFTGADWYIVRHNLTGVILRREITGTIVMKRPDGMCSFHYCVFGQQYNGSTYNKVYTAGITPGQIKLNCEYAE